MIAVDTNILVYAHRAESPFHARARKGIESLANHEATWAIPWPCIHEFLAIVTHPRVFDPPTPHGLAIDQVEAWLESPSVLLLAEEDGHWQALRRLVETAHLQGSRIHDARIAALCLVHGVSELWSADRDFSRFGELKVVNPLV